MNFFEEIVEVAHKNGVKFTFDTDCCATGCKKVAIWEKEITHQTEGDMTLDLCEKHMNEFDENKPFNVEVKSK